MKKFFTLLIFCCIFSSCSDDSSEAITTNPITASLAIRPEANSMFNNSYMGIYKGIVIGNVSGVMYVDLLNDGKIWAKFLTNNQETYILKIAPTTDEGGKSALYDTKKFHFMNENMEFEMELDLNGNNITTSNFNFFSNNTSKICLIKEKSNSLIKCYIGIFSGYEESGTINFTSDGLLQVKGISQKLNSRTFTDVSGKIKLILPINAELKTGNNETPHLKYQLNANLHLGQISGYLKGYMFDGNWMNEDSELGSWKATRIL